MPIHVLTHVTASGDITASQNLLKSIDKWFGLKLLIPNDANEKLIDKLKQISPNNQEDLVSEITQTHDAFYM